MFEIKKALKGRNRECRVMPADRIAVEGPAAGRVINLIPAPCDYLMAGHSPFRFRIWSLPLPSVDGFDKSQRMVYEWLGNVFEGDGE
jgi:hypothetical protein